jgi:hypothetical protein
MAKSPGRKRAPSTPHPVSAEDAYPLVGRRGKARSELLALVGRSAAALQQDAARRVRAALDECAEIAAEHLRRGEHLADVVELAAEWNEDGDPPAPVEEVRQVVYEAVYGPAASPSPAPPPLFPQDWPPSDWECDKYPLNDSDEAVQQWLGTFIEALPVWESTWRDLRIEDSNPAGRIVRDAYRLVRRLREQGRTREQDEEELGQKYTLHDAQVILQRLRDRLFQELPPADSEVVLLKMLTASDVARYLNLPAPRVESALRRFRKKHPDCAEEQKHPRRNEPRWFYRTADIQPVLQQLRGQG